MMVPALIQSELEMEQILQRIALGDEQSLRTLILHYTPLLGPYIFKFTKSRERTEEIIQDIFIQVWQVRETLPSIRSINGFLYVLAKNQALNAVRAAVREYRRRVTYQEMQSAEQPDNTDALGLVEEAVRNLPPQQQRAWVLSRREGKKHTEIAEEMQLSRESVKKYIQWANASITEYVLARTDVVLTAALLIHPVSQTFF